MDSLTIYTEVEIDDEKTLLFNCKYILARHFDDPGRCLMQLLLQI